MKNILTAAILAFSMNVFAQAPTWQWAKSEGGGAIDAGYSTVTDTSGNVYAVGYFQGPFIVFGSTTLLNDTTDNSTDMFIVKYDPNGNVLWAKSAGGNTSDRASAIGIDGSGNIYVCGNYQSPTFNAGSFSITNAGTQNLFITKYDTNGNVIWLRSGGGNSYDAAKLSIAVDTSGNSYVTGSFMSSIASFGSTSVSNSGNTDMFTVKYDTGGNAVWAGSTVGAADEYGTSIAVDKNGNSYVSGYFSGPAITFGSINVTNTGVWDIFVVKYDAGGTPVWAKSQGGSGDDEANAIAVDGAGNVFVTGYYVSPSITFGTYTLTSVGYFKLFTVKYYASGTVAWAKTAAASGGKGIATDESGNTFVSGYFYGNSISFGSITLLNDTTDSSTDIFVVKYDVNGAEVWAKSAGGNKSEEPNDISQDGRGSIYVTGFSASPLMSFGSITINNDSTNIFLAKIEDNCFAHYTTVYDSTTNNFTLTVDSFTSSLAASYSWDFGDGTTSASVSPSHAYTIDTVYNVCMKIYTASGDSCEYCYYIGKDYLGNIIRTTGFTINVQNAGITTGLSNIDSYTSKIVIYPNPFSLQTIIDFKDEQKNTTVRIVDIFGKEVRKIDFKGKQLTIEKGEMKQGIYLIQITDGKMDVINKKIIVQ